MKSDFTLELEKIEPGKFKLKTVSGHIGVAFILTTEEIEWLGDALTVRANLEKEKLKSECAGQF